MQILMGLLGIVVILGLLYIFSSNRKMIRWKTILIALAVQFALAVFIVKIPLGREIMTILSNGVTAVVDCSANGLSFVFGDLADSNKVACFFVQSLGNVVFVFALVEFLYYIGVLGFVVKVIGKGLGKLLGTSAVESFVAVANTFLSMTNAPVLVSKYLSTLTDSEIMVVLVSGMGSVNVAVLGSYAALGIPMEYLLVSCVMVPVGSILVAKMLFPQIEPVTKIDDIKVENDTGYQNALDAIVSGASSGMSMIVSIAASLIAVLGMVALVNLLLGFVHTDLETIFSYILAPFGFMMGFNAQDALREGALLGQKLALNEFIAFGTLGESIQNLDPRFVMMSSISLSGFANLSSMGICVAGIGSLCPEKKGVLARLVFRGMVGGMIVSILNAILCGIVYLL